MTQEPSATIVIAIEIGEAALADRLAAILAGVPGLRLAAPGEPADAALVAGRERTLDPEVALTPRELDVLALLAEGASNKAIARTRCGSKCEGAPSPISSIAATPASSRC